MAQALKILIVEDEPIIALDIREIIEEAGHSCCGIAKNVSKAQTLLVEEECDLVLLDISLAENSSGIDLAKQLNEKYSIPFVFISSHSDVHTSTIVASLNPVGYIVKPVQPQTLLMTITIGYENFLKRHSDSNEIQEDFIYIKDKSKLVRIKFDAILFAEALDNYCYIITEAKRYLINSTLKKVEEKLQDRGFIRIHRSHLVNANHITMIQENFVFIDEHKLLIGKTYRDIIRKKINTF